MALNELYLDSDRNGRNEITDILNTERAMNVQIIKISL